MRQSVLKNFIRPVWTNKNSSRLTLILQSLQTMTILTSGPFALSSENFPEAFGEKNKQGKKRTTNTLPHLVTGHVIVSGHYHSLELIWNVNNKAKEATRRRVYCCSLDPNPRNRSRSFFVPVLPCNALLHNEYSTRVSGTLIRTSSLLLRKMPFTNSNIRYLVHIQPAGKLPIDIYPGLDQDTIKDIGAIHSIQSW